MINGVSVALRMSERWLPSVLVFPRVLSRMRENMGTFHPNLSSSRINDVWISPHILAPTASDLSKYGSKNTILAGFHTDLNFLTIHGRSRYPGLHIWARNTGKRIAVKLPPTGPYLLVQAGKQLEHLTGGFIKAGFHEVVVSNATVEVCLFQTVYVCSGSSLCSFLDGQSSQVRMP